MALAGEGGTIPAEDAVWFVANVNKPLVAIGAVEGIESEGVSAITGAAGSGAFMGIHRSGNLADFIILSASSETGRAPTKRQRRPVLSRCE